MKTGKDQALRNGIVTAVALFLAVFHVTAGVFGPPNTITFKYVHLTAMMVLVFMRKPFTKNAKLAVLNYLDYLFSAATIFVLLYILKDVNAFSLRQGSVIQSDVVLGTVYIILVLEAARRVTGLVMPIIAIIFAGQNLVAQYLPGLLRALPTTYKNLIDYTFMRSGGIIGTPLTIMSTYVIFFMMFAAILDVSGAGQFFIDLALGLTGRSRGGPAKAAVVSSAFFGSISGSAIANVASTGAVTIPLMKKTGYKPEFAGAVEAVSSTGGQIMPPMMGAAAFVVAENLGIPYIKLALFAAIPAIFYFVSVYFMVDFRARKQGLVGMNAEDIPSVKETMKNGWFYLIPIVVLIVLLAIGKSAQMSAIYSTEVLIAIAVLHPRVQIDGKKLLNCISNGILDTSSVSITAACAGIIIAGVSVSGLALKLSNIIIAISGGVLGIALVATAIICILLGMGMTTTAVYITVATLIVPALMNMGVVDISAHLFCFYFGCICAITPPVAMAAYTAAGISGASASKTGWQAFAVGIAAYIVPFLFVVRPELVLQGTVVNCISAIAVTLLAIYCLAGIVQGCTIGKLKWFDYVLMSATIIAAFIPSNLSDIIAIAIGAVAIILQRIRFRKGAKAV